MTTPRYPTLYQVNTRVWLTELSRALGRRATLDDIPNAALDQFSAQGFDWIWLLSVWQTGAAAQAVSRSNAGWRHEFAETLPDLTEEDIAGSGFAITNYVIHRELGGDAALARVRKRLHERGLKLMLDLVPNHMAPDHPWVESHSDFFISGNETDLANAPQNYFRTEVAGSPHIFAHGRDPYFPGWPDTIQLNYGNPALQDAMTRELTRIAGQCDGVRCDMAMLILPDVFKRTWGIDAKLFWPNAISAVRAKRPDFLFMAEVYWDLEWTLQQQGFHYCYDKRLYDRLREGHARPVREHFLAEMTYQNHLARFLENHDEPRAAATFSNAQHQAAAILTFLAPGLRFFHQGQFEGHQKRISPHLVRAPIEPTDLILQSFYTKLFEALKRPTLRDGNWQLLGCEAAWGDNRTNEDFIAFGWENISSEPVVVAVNYSDHQSQAKVLLPFQIDISPTYRFNDLLSGASYEWAGAELANSGLFVDLPPWGAHLLSMSIKD